MPAPSPSAARPRAKPHTWTIPRSDMLSLKPEGKDAADAQSYIGIIVNGSPLFPGLYSLLGKNKKKANAVEATNNNWKIAPTPPLLISTATDRDEKDNEAFKT